MFSNRISPATPLIFSLAVLPGAVLSGCNDDTPCGKVTSMPVPGSAASVQMGILETSAGNSPVLRTSTTFPGDGVGREAALAEGATLAFRVGLFPGGVGIKNGDLYNAASSTDVALPTSSSDVSDFREAAESSGVSVELMAQTGSENIGKIILPYGNIETGSLPEGIDPSSPGALYYAYGKPIAHAMLKGESFERNFVFKSLTVVFEYIEYVVGSYGGTLAIEVPRYESGDIGVPPVMHYYGVTISYSGGIGTVTVGDEVSVDTSTRVDKSAFFEIDGEDRYVNYDDATGIVAALPSDVDLATVGFTPGYYPELTDWFVGNGVEISPLLRLSDDGETIVSYDPWLALGLWPQDCEINFYDLLDGSKLFATLPFAMGNISGATWHTLNEIDPEKSWVHKDETGVHSLYNVKAYAACQLAGSGVFDWSLYYGVPVYLEAKVDDIPGCSE